MPYIYIKKNTEYTVNTAPHPEGKICTRLCMESGNSKRFFISLIKNLIINGMKYDQHCPKS